jgi:hypothetical protein
VLAEVRQLARKGSAPKLDARRHLVAINERGLTLLKTVLSEANAATLEQRYVEVGYPEVYPDRASAHRLYEAALGIDSLQDGQRAAIEAHLDRFVRDHACLSARMTDTIFRKREGLMTGLPEGQWAAGTEIQNQLDLGLEREQLNEKQAAILRGILSPDQFAQLPDWDFEANPPPRPWDHGNWLRRRAEIDKQRAEMAERRAEIEERRPR